MKIRQGFVSNSSSSSFVVVGKKVSLKDISLDDFQNGDFMIETGYYYEGTVNIHTKYFDKDQLERLYNYLKDDSVEDEIRHSPLIEVYERGGDEGELTLKVVQLPDVSDLTIVYGNEDQHSPTDMNELEELLGDGEYL